MDYPITTPDLKAAYVEKDERVAFIRRAYLHLGAAMLAFIGLEYLFLNSPLAGPYLDFAFGGRFSWLIILGLFIVNGWVADSWAQSDQTPAKQYLGLGVYVAAEVVLFAPLLVIAAAYSSFDVIPSAAIVTLCVFTGLTAIVFLSGADFSFLRMALMGAGLLAFGLIAASLLIGFSLGVLFSVAMVGLAAGYVLYNTSNVLHHYRTDQHVAAALALFADIALLFWYILRIFMSRRR
jgi:FtsH-binding integral membrane protein